MAARLDHGHHRLRIGRYSAPGLAYHVTLSTRDRQPVFECFDAARVLIRSMRFADQAGWCSTYAFVVMPDHAHWLFALGPKRSLSEVVQSVKKYTSRQMARRRLTDGPVWEVGFFDHAVRADEDLVIVSRYIVANPLRAGLCREIGDYPHWDAVWVGQ